MINVEFDEFDDTDEGKMLLAAIAILTSLSCKDIEEQKYGGMSHPHDVFDRIKDLSNEIFFEEEYNKYIKSVERQNKIDSITNE